MKYAFVTVTHGADWGLLRLQARSLQRYLPRDLAAEIIVIDNPTPGQAALGSAAIRDQYGELASLVRVIDAADVADVPAAASGWWSQQILKLMASRCVTTDRYVLLDAKNHLVFPLTRGFLEAGGKIRSRRMSYRTHPMRPFFERTVRYFGLNPASRLDAFLPTTTPFTLPTQTVRDLIAHVAARERVPFPVAVYRRQLTEFFLFACYISTGGRRIEDMYDLSGAACPTIWEEVAAQGVDGIAAMIAGAEQDMPPFFAVHRRAMPKLSDEARRIIAEFWCRRELFETVSDGVDFLFP